jgi:hypothetical protein
MVRGDISEPLRMAVLPAAMGNRTERQPRM